MQSGLQHLDLPIQVVLACGVAERRSFCSATSVVAARTAQPLLPSDSSYEPLRMRER
jgi:hypothetical protein